MSDPFAATMRHHSKSFSLAALLLPPAARDDARVLYAYCRQVDDAVDDESLTPEAASRRLAALRAQLDRVYAGQPTGDPVADAFAALVARHAIPRAYPDALLDGMEMDVRGARYETVDDVLRYGYRVASTVGLMMCHVLGVRHESALRPAAHLGVAMQLTNIARDVREDWGRGRRYLPASLLVEAGQTPPPEPAPGAPWPTHATPAMAHATRALLDTAEVFYRSADRGMDALSLRASLGVRAARLIYSRIGAVLRRRGCDPTRERAYVSRARKLWLLVRAAVATVFGSLVRGLRGRRGHPPRRPESTLALEEAVRLPGPVTARRPLGSRGPARALGLALVGGTLGLAGLAPAAQAAGPPAEPQPAAPAPAQPQPSPDAAPAKPRPNPDKAPASPRTSPATAPDRATKSPPPEPATKPKTKVSATPGHVEVRVRGCKSARGAVQVALFRSARGFPNTQAAAWAHVRATIEAGHAVATFPSVPPGSFAVVAFHDLDDDGHLDRNFLGAPSEPYGASRDARRAMGPPRWRDARLELQPGATVEVKIRVR